MTLVRRAPEQVGRVTLAASRMLVMRPKLRSRHLLHQHGRFEPASDMQLLKDARKIVLDRLVAELQARADLLVAQALRRRSQDGALPGCSGP